MVQVKDILTWVDAHAPLRFSESWDSCGLQVGDPEGKVDRVLVALDPGSETLLEAEAKDCQCLLTHHPLIFRPLSAVRPDLYPGALVMMALQKGVHVISAHSNLDVALGGTNDQLARLLSVQPAEPLEAASHLKGERGYMGLGCLGTLPRKMSLKDFAEFVQGVLGGVSMRVVGDLQKSVEKVALCTGSGGSLVEQVLARKVDVYVTGDVKYHEAQRALEGGLALLDVGHFASERVVVEPLAQMLRFQAAESGKSLVVLTSQSEKDPFVVF